MSVDCVYDSITYSVHILFMFYWWPKLVSTYALPAGKLFLTPRSSGFSVDPLGPIRIQSKHWELCLVAQHTVQVSGSFEFIWKKKCWWCWSTALLTFFQKIQGCNGNDERWDMTCSSQWRHLFFPLAFPRPVHLQQLVMAEGSAASDIFPMYFSKGHVTCWLYLGFQLAKSCDPFGFQSFPFSSLHCRLHCGLEPFGRAHRTNTESLDLNLRWWLQVQVAFIAGRVKYDLNCKKQTDAGNCLQRGIVPAGIDWVSDFMDLDVGRFGSESDSCRDRNPCLFHVPQLHMCKSVGQRLLYNLWTHSPNSGDQLAVSSCFISFICYKYPVVCWMHHLWVHTPAL